MPPSWLKSFRRHTNRSRLLCRPVLETLEDRAVPATFTVTNTNNANLGSLRRAINDANGTAGVDTIVFAIGSGPQTIHLNGTVTGQPAAALPPITEAVVIDATTQPGFNTLSRTPIIELNGSLIPSTGTP